MTLDFSDESVESFAERGDVFVGNGDDSGSVFDGGGRLIDEIECLVRKESIVDMSEGSIERDRHDIVGQDHFMK